MLLLQLETLRSQIVCALYQQLNQTANTGNTGTHVGKVAALMLWQQSYEFPKQTAERTRRRIYPGALLSFLPMGLLSDTSSAFSTSTSLRASLASGMNSCINQASQVAASDKILYLVTTLFVQANFEAHLCEGVLDVRSESRQQHSSSFASIVTIVRSS